MSQAQVVADITAAAEKYGVSVSWMLKTANCESHFHWNSVNPSGPYIGVFQFLMSTFIANGGHRGLDLGPRGPGQHRGQDVRRRSVPRVVLRLNRG